MTGQHNKISEPSKTALLAALHRSVAHKEFKSRKFGTDYLAELFLPSYIRFLIKFKKMRAKGKAKGETQTPGLYEYVLARTVFFDSLFNDYLDESIPQIVLLGAGYDSRANRFEDNITSTRIFELDSDTTQNRKLQCMRKFRVKRPKQTAYVSIDFNKQLLKDVLERAGYEPNKKTLFLWEGVCMYLEPESVDAVFEFITHSSHSESIVAFDYAISLSDAIHQNYYGAEKLAQRLAKNKSNAVFKFTIDNGKIERFLNQRKLKIIKHLNQTEIENLLTIDGGAPIGQPTGLFRFVMASPNR